MKLSLIPKRRAQADWESAQAVISLAGVRPLLQDAVNAAATTNTDYTVDGVGGTTRRVVLFHSSGNLADIRVALNATATASDMPVVSGVYFSLEVETGDVVSLYNVTGSPIVVNVMEIG